MTRILKSNSHGLVAWNVRDLKPDESIPAVSCVEVPAWEEVARFDGSVPEVVGLLDLLTDAERWITRRVGGWAILQASEAEIRNHLALIIHLVARREASAATAEAFKNCDAADELIEGDEELRLCVDLLRRARVVEKKWNRAEQLVGDHLRAAIGEHGGIAGLVTWASSESEMLDVERLRQEEPGIFERYRVAGFRRSLRLM